MPTKKTTDSPEDVVSEQPFDYEAYMEERIPVMFPFSAEKAMEDVVACVNGDIVRAKRGVTVQMKRKHVNVLLERDAQEMKAAMMAAASAGTHNLGNF